MLGFEEVGCHDVKYHVTTFRLCLLKLLVSRWWFHVANLSLALYNHVHYA